MYGIDNKQKMYNNRSPTYRSRPSAGVYRTPHARSRPITTDKKTPNADDFPSLGAPVRSVPVKTAWGDKNFSDVVKEEHEFNEHLLSRTATETDEQYIAKINRVKLSIKSETPYNTYKVKNGKRSKLVSAKHPVVARCLCVANDTIVRRRVYTREVSEIVRDVKAEMDDDPDVWCDVMDRVGRDLSQINLAIKMYVGKKWPINTSRKLDMSWMDATCTLVTKDNGLTEKIVRHTSV
jgi:hypothetical protein